MRSKAKSAAGGRRKKKIKRAGLDDLPEWMKDKRCPRKRRYLSGQRILPPAITGKENLSDLLKNSFLAYNSARLKEGSRLFTEKILKPNVTVGMTLAGALTPAGLGVSCIVPLIKAGFVDWIVTTGANIYHDLHFALNKPLYAGTPNVNDADLRSNEIVRIYDIFIDYKKTLIKTDRLLCKILLQPEFRKEMGTAEFHYLLGKYAAMMEEKNRQKDVSVLAAAYRAKVPIYTSAPGDSTIGMDIAGLELEGLKLRINPSIDVNETAAIVLNAKKKKGKSGIILIGGGSPKNFILQTEPHIQEILFLKDVGHDYFFQITDARPDTGGLSGATPREAVSWGKINPKELPNAVVCYIDSTIALPIITHYAFANHKKRPLKKLYSKRDKMMKYLKQIYFKYNERIDVNRKWSVR